MKNWSNPWVICGFVLVAATVNLVLMFWMVVFAVYVLEIIGVVDPGSASKVADIFPV